MNTANDSILHSLHTVIKFKGAFRSAKQRKFLVSAMTEAALTIRTLGELNGEGNFVAHAREYTLLDNADRIWAFTCYRTDDACTEGALTRRKVLGCERALVLKIANEKVPAPVTISPASLGPIVSESVREELRSITKWGPSEFIFLAPSVETRNALEVIAKLDASELDSNRSRKVSEAWNADDLKHITQVQIAAKGLLCEIGDNAGTSPMSMSAADAEYISQMITEGHIRNAHWFKRKSMPEKALRRATIVNEAKMDPATAALARRMVDLMNDEAGRLGRPVGFAEYVEIMTEAA